MLLAITLFSPSTLVGVLSPVFFLIAIGFAAWAYARVHIGRAQDQAILTWKLNYEAQKERAELADTAAAQEADEKRRLVGELAVEKLKTDQTIVLAEIVQFHKDFADREVLFHRLLSTLESGRDEISLQIKTMETRLIGLIGEQTSALREITNAVIKSNGHK